MPLPILNPQALPSPSPIAAGALVAGRYELIRHLGSGAAGTVWEARHVVLKSRVALKFLEGGVEASGQHPTIAERFHFEAQIGARLAACSPYIVGVHDAGSFEGVPFIAMEFAPGEALEQVLEKGELTPAAAGTAITHVAKALDAAHERGVVHRDVKPANVLCLRQDGSTVYKLADFGVAKWLGEAPEEFIAPKRTAENMLVGTPVYMSPEVFAGETAVDATQDIWALAIMAYELLCDHLPFDAPTWLRVAAAVERGEFEAISKRLGRASPELDAVFARALATHPEERYARASEFASAYDVAIRLDLIRGEKTRAQATARVPSIPAPLDLVVHSDLPLPGQVLPAESAHPAKVVAVRPIAPSAAPSDEHPRSEPPVTREHADDPALPMRRRRWPWLVALVALLTVGSLWIGLRQAADPSRVATTGQAASTSEVPPRAEPPVEANGPSPTIEVATQQGASQPEQLTVSAANGRQPSDAVPSSSAPEASASAAPIASSPAAPPAPAAPVAPENSDKQLPKEEVF